MVDVVQAADEKLSSSLGYVSLAKQYAKSIAGCNTSIVLYAFTWGQLQQDYVKQAMAIGCL